MRNQTDLWFLGGIRQLSHVPSEETSAVDKQTEQTALHLFCPPPIPKALDASIWNVATRHAEGMEPLRGRGEMEWQGQLLLRFSFHTPGRKTIDVYDSPNQPYMAE